MASAALSSWLSRLTHAQACYAFAASGALTFPLLFFVSAPYGKFFNTSRSKGWGPALGGRAGWFVQEIISPIALLCAFYGAQSASLPPGAPLPLQLAPVHGFVFLWCLHYAHRAVLYPLQRHMSATTVPVVAAAVAFNVINGALVGAELAAVAHSAFADWRALASPRVLGGLALMFAGAGLNIASDVRLRALRAKPGDRSYHVPRGGFFELVACPHYLGEIAEWSGFAVATGMLSAAVFAFWTAANLAPRALATRNWYRQKFRDEYPATRKALVPFIF